MNFGLPGRDTEEELKILKEDVLKYNPEIVMWQYYPNDFININEQSPKLYRTLPIPFMFYLRNSLYVFSYAELRYNLYYNNKYVNYEDYLIEGFNSNKSREYNKGLFRKLSDLSKENDFEVRIIMFPAFNFGGEYKLKVSDDFVKEIVEENNFTLIDVSSIYRDNNIEEISVGKYDLHPNEFGHELIAREILR